MKCVCWGFGKQKAGKKWTKPAHPVECELSKAHSASFLRIVKKVGLLRLLHG